LQTIKKEGLSMNDFLTKVAVLKDSLAAAGDKLQESEVILITLGALGDEYESFVTAITTRYDESLTFTTLCELLLDYEVRVQNARLPPTVNVQSKSSDSPSVNFASRSGDSSARTDTKCQICTRKGHIALNCYNRLNLKKFKPTHNRELTPDGLSATNRSTNLSANTISSSPVSLWFPDSGATSHITPQAENIQMPRSFEGKKIYTADGTPLNILSSGSSMAGIDNKKFLLTDLLHVPSATRNLLSIHRFCVDNNVSVNFNASKVQVWKQGTREVLAEGSARGGLYELNLDLGHTVALNCSYDSHFLWHCRLGHLNANSMSVLIKNRSINSDSNKVRTCDSCLAGKSHSSPHPSRTTSYKPLELVFADIWGPAPLVSST